MAFEIVTALDAVEVIVAHVDAATMSKGDKRPLVVTLTLAQAAFEAGDFALGVDRLRRFQEKVQNRIIPIEPELATQLIDAAQAIIDAVRSP